MAKQVKKIYRFFLWFFSAIAASGTLTGCGRLVPLYGAPKYGPPPPYEKVYGTVIQKGGGPIKNIRLMIPETGMETTTSPTGEYKIDFYSDLPDVTIQAEDIDGVDNGGDFASKNVTLNILSSDNHEANIELELKSAH